MQRVYKVLVQGSNCLVQLEGTIQSMGFFVARFVEADDVEAAERQALERVRTELDARSLLNQAPDSPTLRVEDVSEIVGDYFPDCGFAWFRERAEKQ